MNKELRADRLIFDRERPDLETVPFDNITMQELQEIELEKKLVKNIREKAAITAELVTKDTEVIYDSFRHPRPKYEVVGGSKIALKRKANIKEVELYNLYFLFKRPDLDGTSIALMCRPLKGKEWILLLPDNTDARIEAERSVYIAQATNEVFKGNLSSDEQNWLLENLNRLNIVERCGQTVMHEYGHVLHWRIFDAFDLHTPERVYEWFCKYGYAELLDKRTPKFYGAEVLDKIYLLKECLVEDYRISLNIDSEDGMFILPNAVAHLGDMFDQSLLHEGVNLMKKMLEDASGKQTGMGGSGFSQELDRVFLAIENYQLYQSTSWRPGKSTMSDQDHLNVIEQLKENEKKTKLQNV